MCRPQSYSFDGFKAARLIFNYDCAAVLALARSSLSGIAVLFPRRVALILDNVRESIRSRTGSANS